jgi:hypothetical protein
MKFDQIIAIVGQVATWLTLVVVFFTLREMNIQRRQSYKPDLVPLQDYVYVFWKTNPNGVFPNRWVTTPKRLADGTPQSTEPAAVRVVNLGVGAAGTVTAKWELQIHSLLGEIKEYCDVHSLPVAVEVKNRWLSVEAPGGTEMRNNFDFICKEDYLLPADRSPDGLAFPFPSQLLQLTSLLFYLIASATDQNNVPESFRGAAPFTLELAYSALGGDAYSKTFSGKLNLEMWALSVLGEGGQALSGRWHWEEIERD